jgi:hypothetical protein
MSSYWRVYVHLYGHATVYVAAPNADVALGRARERLAVDALPSEYRTVSQPTSIGEWERKQFEVEEVSHVLRGRRLTADEVAYCNGRGYSSGPDIDAFHGLQWMHIVDDGVAFCRTHALEGSGGKMDGETRISCSFCLDMLHKEMRYEHLSLHVDWRQRGAHGAAKVSYDGDGVHLKVNGVVVQSAQHDPSIDPNDPDHAFDAAYARMRELSDAINEAQAKRRDAEPPPALPTPARDGRYRKAVYIAMRSALDYDYDERLSAEQRTRLSKETAALYMEMTPEEQADVNAYFKRD